MRKAEYTVNINDDQNAETILAEKYNYFIELEHKYPTVQVEA